MGSQTSMVKRGSAAFWILYLLLLPLVACTPTQPVEPTQPPTPTPSPTEGAATPATQVDETFDTSRLDAPAYVTFAINVHDIVYVNESGDTLLRLIDLFEEYGVRGDFLPDGANDPSLCRAAARCHRTAARK